MDTQKDTIDHQTNPGTDVSDKTPRTPVFQDRLKLSVECLKRTERLSAALYMVTGLVPDVEPLKWKLRERSLALLNDMSFTRDLSVSDRIGITERASDTVTEIVTLLNVALAGDLLSEMNVSILKKEYGVLRDLIKMGDTVTSAREGSVRDLFAGDIGQPSGLGSVYDDSERKEEERRAGIIEHLKDMRHVMSDTKGHDKDIYARVESPIMSFRKEVSDIQHATQSVSSELKNSEINQTIQSIKDERRKNIVAIIKKKRHVTIKDIAHTIHTVGEKTIQRELAAMVEEGVLKKEGEKRWSTYTLAL